jgi:RNA polymerase sigma-70 factor (ECF subfamily)
MSASADISQLLQHASWMRRLARSLTGDDAAADDLVQETWMAALRSPPRAGETVRPWLGRVLRNVRVTGFRRDSRRARRHEAVAAAEATVTAANPTSDRLLETMQQQRQLSELVLALDEPYRSTLLMRFYEELSAADIAARLNVPAGTVRWRLKTGLDQLRDELDRRHGGDRRAWMQALSLWTTTTTALTRKAAAKGALPLKGATLVKLGLAGILAVGAASSFVALRTTRANSPSSPMPAVAAAQPTSAVTSPAVVAAARATPAENASAVAPAADEHAAPTGARGRAPAAGKRATTTAVAASSGAAPAFDQQFVTEQLDELSWLMNGCYLVARHKDRMLKGIVIVTFELTGEPAAGGTVVGSKVDKERSTIKDAAMQECVQETVYGAKFPPPRYIGPAVIEQTFKFGIYP